MVSTRRGSWWSCSPPYQKRQSRAGGYRPSPLLILAGAREIPLSKTKKGRQGVDKGKEAAQDREKRVKKELTRLRRVFRDMDPEKMAVCDGLISQAARLRVLLDDAWKDIAERGDVEAFTQSPDLPSYERQRPVAQLYNTRDKNYQTVIKQLLDQLPEGQKQAEEAAELVNFLKRPK